MCAGRQKAEQERRIGSRRLLIAGKLAGKQTHGLLERLKDRPQDGQIDIKHIIVAASQLLCLVVMFHRRDVPAISSRDTPPGTDTHRLTPLPSKLLHFRCVLVWNPKINSRNIKPATPSLRSYKPFHGQICWQYLNPAEDTLTKRLSLIDEISLLVTG